MVLFGSNTEKFPIFSYISGNRNHKKSFIFQETETLKSFLYFRKWNFFAPENSIKLFKTF